VRDAPEVATMETPEIVDFHEPDQPMLHLRALGFAAVTELDGTRIGADVQRSRRNTGHPLKSRLQIHVLRKMLLSAPGQSMVPWAARWPGVVCA
jgi:hypothetical protein